MKRGRHPKPAGERLDVALDFRVTEAEADRVYVRAIRERKAVATLLRDVLWDVFAGVPRERDVTPGRGWHASGRYYETCSCDVACPCASSGMTDAPTGGACTFTMAFHVAHGRYGDTVLDGRGFILAGRAPGPMAHGNWSVGMVVDAHADESQREALVVIGRGDAGGPLARLSGLWNEFLGVIPAPIRFDDDGSRWTVEAPDYVEMAAEVPPLTSDAIRYTAPDRPHPAHVRRAHLRAWGLTLDANGGGQHAQHAPFAWHHD